VDSFRQITLNLECEKDNDTGSIGDHFVRWQCGLRQLAMRLEGGRLSLGMRPNRQDGSEKEHR
jgi:hypothetical protein